MRVVGIIQIHVTLSWEIKGLECAARKEYVPAQLELAHVFSTRFRNDPFQPDKNRAEYWYRRAIGGSRNQIWPLAFTRYGEFLLIENRLAEANDLFQIAADFVQTRGQHQYALILLKGQSRGKMRSLKPVYV